ncbi:MLP-like protein 31 [Rhodamnia argentea]|uniref:MLP-like protein 31 n=1 Tax=Rhodamnia argentea TaxID=178133 RepID=A0A8B8P3D0_9MYRT|nr:MLP-like protein 31 [Rhodamnia argentea]XP_030529281.1 MLP-like protein 31 [Rhodamnia argentea]XP_048135008.1 MLP-like protein 31 [Rhodamnia argentea]
MTVHGKMEIDFEIKAPADKFHDVFSCRPHHIPNISADKIQGVEMHDGDWGKAGSIISWNYTHDGEAKVAKELIEAIDDEKNLTTFRVLEGDLMKLYKNFVFSVQATSKEGGGSIVHLTIEYEKLSEEVTEPYSMLQFGVHLSKDIDLHLMEQAQA